MISPTSTLSAHHHHPTADTITASPHDDDHHDIHSTPQTAKQQLEAANIAHFDALSVDYDTRHPEAHQLALRLARALRRALPLDEDKTSVLDYACGSGTASTTTQKKMTHHHHHIRTSIACSGAVRCAPRRCRYQPSHGRTVQRARRRARSRTARNARGLYARRTAGPF